MDRLNRLQALLGDNQVEGENTPGDDSPPWTHWEKPKHIYEGTDSEDDEQAISRRVETHEEEASGLSLTETRPGKKVFYFTFSISL
jgi:hypothetical protein